jgi:excisionase family DNA binding protein
MNERWLSLAEIAVYLGVSKDSVYRWVELRNMPAHKVGRQWKFKAAEVDAWVRSGKADCMAAPVAVHGQSSQRQPARARKGR